MGRIFRTLLVLFVLGGIGVGGFAGYLFHWANKPVNLSQPVVLELSAGLPLVDFAHNLAINGVVDDAHLYYALVRAQGDYPRFQAGTYQFTGSISPNQVTQKIIQGDAYEPIILTYTIPEGFSLNQILARLAANGIGHAKQLEKLAYSAAFAAELKIPGDNLEGFIFPATYSWTYLPSPRKALTHMVETFWKKLPENYEANLKKMGLTLYEAVTFASLIEKETMHDDEKPLISEVIWARLKDKVPLAIDATIIYGIPDFDGDITWAHLKDASNPYNSRIHKGLPPTPIGAPGTEALAAILTPTDTGAYYYVLKPGTDRHHFSKTLREHQRHVRKLVEAGRRKRYRE